MPADARMQDSNPFVEIATHLFLEDLAGKVGVAGLNNYLVSLAKNLAAAMPREEYASWSEFVGAVRDSQSILSTFEAGGDHPHEARDAPPEPLRRVAPGAGVVTPDRAAAPRSSGIGPAGTPRSR